MATTAPVLQQRQSVTKSALADSEVRSEAQLERAQVSHTDQTRGLTPEAASMREERRALQAEALAPRSTQAKANFMDSWYEFVKVSPVVVTGTVVRVYGERPDGLAYMFHLRVDRVLKGSQLIRAGQIIELSRMAEECIPLGPRCPPHPYSISSSNYFSFEEGMRALQFVRTHEGRWYRGGNCGVDHILLGSQYSLEVVPAIERLIEIAAIADDETRHEAMRGEAHSSNPLLQCEASQFLSEGR